MTMDLYANPSDCIIFNVTDLQVARFLEHQIFGVCLCARGCLNAWLILPAGSISTVNCQPQFDYLLESRISVLTDSKTKVRYRVNWLSIIGIAKLFGISDIN